VMIRIPPDLHTIIQGVEGERHHLLPKLVLQQVGNSIKLHGDSS
jgi:hypothetical protein